MTASHCCEPLLGWAGAAVAAGTGAGEGDLGNANATCHLGIRA